MPPFCRLRLLTGDEHAHSFCRCVDLDQNQCRVTLFTSQFSKGSVLTRQSTLKAQGFQQRFNRFSVDRAIKYKYKYKSAFSNENAFV